MAKFQACALLALCAFSAVSARQLLQAPVDQPVTNDAQLEWNLDLTVTELGVDLGLLQYLNTTEGVTASKSKTIQWDLSREGLFSTVLFGGASCAEYSFTEDCGNASSYVVDNTVAQLAAKRAVPISQIDASKSVEDPQGINYASQCDTSCSDRVFGLAPTSAYDFVLNQDSNQDTCDITTTFSAYNEAAPICQGQSAPANAVASTIPTLRNNLQVYGSEANVSYLLDFNNASAWTFSGAACAYASIFIPYDPTNVMDFLGLDLLTVQDYINAIDAEDMTADITDAPKVASCKGQLCNAKNTQGWLRAATLDNDTSYVVVISKNSSLNSVNYTTSSAYAMVQAGTADQCSPVVASPPPPVAVPVVAPAVAPEVVMSSPPPAELSSPPPSPVQSLPPPPVAVQPPPVSFQAQSPQGSAAGTPPPPPPPPPPSSSAQGVSTQN